MYKRKSAVRCLPAQSKQNHNGEQFRWEQDLSYNKMFAG